MKHILFILLFLPLMASAQTKADYEQVMNKFVTYYNADQRDNACDVLFQPETKDKKCFWRWVNKNSSLLSEFGPIISYKYLGKVTSDPEKVIVFKVVFAKRGVKALSFNLEENGKFGTFRFNTTDEEIEAMLSRAK